MIDMAEPENEWCRGRFTVDLARLKILIAMEQWRLIRPHMKIGTTILWPDVARQRRKTERLALAGFLLLWLGAGAVLFWALIHDEAGALTCLLVGALWGWPLTWIVEYFR